VSVIAAAIARRARRARICIMGALLPINSPVRSAEEYALIDTLSVGRLVAGLLRGAPYEYLVYNAPPAESRSRFEEEAWELVMRAWCPPSRSAGKASTISSPTCPSGPDSYDRRLPPVFISGSSRESAEFAARKHIGLSLAFTNIPEAIPSLSTYCQTASSAGSQARAGHLRPRTRLSRRL
jgi:alkanesulfonate monooxygenase SsuD/methylene tetrahydromethanopterin reductase-like flavin-dependent oxidoreductase (luciferase family)